MLPKLIIIGVFLFLLWIIMELYSQNRELRSQIDGSFQSFRDRQTEKQRKKNKACREYVCQILEFFEDDKAYKQKIEERLDEARFDLIGEDQHRAYFSLFLDCYIDFTQRFYKLGEMATHGEVIQAAKKDENAKRGDFALKLNHVVDMWLG